MSLRTSDTLVRNIIDLASAFDTTPFMEVANEIVTEKCTSSGYSAARLIKIETWLAAHFCAISDPRAVSEEADEVRERYQSKVDLGFNVTHYGQQAMLIDTAGNLAALNDVIVNGKPTSISLAWLGKTKTEVESES